MVGVVAGALAWIVLTRTSAVYDNSPAIAIHKQIVLDPIVNGDGRLKYRALYDKRPYCDVVAGSYEIKGRTKKGAVVHLENVQPRHYGTWPVGKNQEVTSAVEMPDDLPSGHYQTRWTYSYRCAGTFREQMITSPWMTFERRRARAGVSSFAAPAVSQGTADD